MPLISVVIPVYNGERTIQETVNSVLNQTFQDFELIVINDGSQDSTLDILGKIQDPRLTVYSYPNRGLSASRNRGIDHACGEFISFLDADDLWTTDKLNAQLKALQENPEAAVSYSWTDFIDESGKLLGYGIHYTANGYVFSKLLKFFFVGSGSNALIRKQVFDEAGRFDETLTSAEDWDMFLRLAARYHFAAVSISQILYRVTDTSMSGNVIRQEREMLKVIEHAFAQEPGMSLRHLKRYTYANLYIYLTSRTLKGTPKQQNGLLAARFLWRSIKSNPAILRQFRYTSTLIFKIATSVLLPPRLALGMRAKIKLLVEGGS